MALIDQVLQSIEASIDREYVRKIVESAALSV